MVARSMLLMMAGAMSADAFVAPGVPGHAGLSLRSHRAVVILAAGAARSQRAEPAVCLSLAPSLPSFAVQRSASYYLLNTSFQRL